MRPGHLTFGMLGEPCIFSGVLCLEVKVPQVKAEKCPTLFAIFFFSTLLMHLEQGHLCGDNKVYRCLEINGGQTSGGCYWILESFINRSYKDLYRRHQPGGKLVQHLRFWIHLNCANKWKHTVHGLR